MGDYFLWLKSLHIISVIAWMAGMLYLPRLFVYHVAAAPGSVQSETFKTMELRLYYYIMTPAALLVLITGGGLAASFGTALFHYGWFHIKLLAVVLMLGVHHALGISRKAFAQDRNRHTAKFFRIINEVPTVLLIVIVIMVVVQPF